MPTPEQVVEMHTTFLFRQQRINEILRGFDPNEQVQTVWGVYSPGRIGPKFRVFYRKVDAVNSVKNTRSQSGAVYSLSGSRWELYEVWVDGKELYR